MAEFPFPFDAGMGGGKTLFFLCSFDQKYSISREGNVGKLKKKNQPEVPDAQVGDSSRIIQASFSNYGEQGKWLCCFFSPIPLLFPFIFPPPGSMALLHLFSVMSWVRTEDSRLKNKHKQRECCGESRRWKEAHLRGSFWLQVLCFGVSRG